MGSTVSAAGTKLTQIRKSKSSNHLQTPQHDSLAASSNSSLAGSASLSSIGREGTLFINFRNKNFVHPTESIKNGITGRYISGRLLKIASVFWLGQVENTDDALKMEIACCLLCNMMANTKVMQPITVNLIRQNINLKMQSLKILAMITYLIRNMCCDNIDLFGMLQRLAPLHRQYGVRMMHFNLMIKSLHETMSYYFPMKYNIDVQYAMDQIVSVAGQIMSNERVSDRGRTTSFHGRGTSFLTSVEACLSSDIGVEYFFNYLHSKYCPELAVYLRLTQKLKQTGEYRLSDKERLQVAEEIMDECISCKGKHAINVSYDTRQQLLDSFALLSAHRSSAVLPEDFFESSDIEIRRLVLQNHWYAFVDSVCNLRNSVSFQLNSLDLDD